MSSAKLQSGAVEKKRIRRRAIHLPSVDPGCYVALRCLHLGQYESSLHLLAERTRWDDLKQMLQPVADLVVKDAMGQCFVDSVRCRFDAVKISDADEKSEYPFIAQIMMSLTSVGDEEILKMLLAVGMDPDLPDFRKWRPSHWCGFLARVDLAGLIFSCRPDVTAKCDPGLTPFQVSDRYKDEKEDPRRSVLRADVRDYIKNGRFETSFPTLPELAVRRLWFAVKNLLRRGVVAEGEFTEKVGGKTAAEWAEADKELGVAKEIRYYATAPSTRLEETAKQMTAMAEKLCDKEDKESAMSSEFEKMKIEALEKDTKIEQLSEAVAMFRSRLEEAGIRCGLNEIHLSGNYTAPGNSSHDEGCIVKSNSFLPAVAQQAIGSEETTKSSSSSASTCEVESVEQKTEKKEDRRKNDRIPDGKKISGGSLVGSGASESSSSSGLTSEDMAQSTPSPRPPVGTDVTFSAFGLRAKASAMRGAAMGSGQTTMFTFTETDAACAPGLEKEDWLVGLGDPNFVPNVPLPALVELKTGEEDEEVVYSHRAKLFRFSSETNEWKERGLGDFKILHNAKTGRYRALLRREAVHRIACNFPLLPEMDLLPMETALKAWMVYAKDYSDGDGWQDWLFSIKFKTVDIAKGFKNVWDECIEKIKVASKNPPRDVSHVEDTPVEDEEDESYDEPNSVSVIETAKLLLKGPKDSESKNCGDVVVLVEYDWLNVEFYLYIRAAGNEENTFVHTVLTYDQEYDVEGSKFAWKGINEIGQGDKDYSLSEYTLIFSDEKELKRLDWHFETAKSIIANS